MHARVRREELGFTLIELLIIIMILGILAAIVVFNVGTARSDAAQTTCKTAMNSVQLSAEAYNTRIGHYPDTQAEVVGPDGVLKDWPTSEVYSLTYTPVGYSAGPPIVHATDFILTVKDGAGDTVADCGGL